MINKDERRSEIRLDVQINANVKKIRAYNKDVDLPKPFNIDIKNLSCSGMAFCTKLDIPENMIFYLNLLINNNIIFATAEIVWKLYSNDKFNYGCQFYDLTNYEEQMLRRFIYQEQLKQERERNKLNED